jgi:RES domain-containing protein
MRLWRIAAETIDYKANDLSGGGAAAQPGRWNASGEYVVYTASNRSLAILETFANIDAAGLPLNRFLVEIEVPIDEWNKREKLDQGLLDPAWCAVPAGKASVDAGSAWYQAGKSLLLEVPSVIVPEEHNIVINAKHPAAASLGAKTIRPYSFANVRRK